MTDDVRLVAGLDVGQRVDPSAIALAEETTTATGEALFLVRFLGRLPLGTPYPQVAQRVVEVLRNAVARLRVPVYADADHPQGAGWVISNGYDFGIRVRLYSDITGVGRPVHELIEAELEAHGEQARLHYEVELTGCTFTHGDRLVARDGLSVGKAFLVSRLQSLIHTGRIAIAPSPEADVMRRELLDYEIRVTADANDTYGSFRVGSHDDLVTALGLAVLRDFNPQPSTVYDYRTGKRTA